MTRGTRRPLPGGLPSRCTPGLRLRRQQETCMSSTCRVALCPEWGLAEPRKPPEAAAGLEEGDRRGIRHSQAGVSGGLVAGHQPQEDRHHC